MSWVEEAKRRSAEAAAEHVESGSIIGLGSGSTALHFVHIVGSRLRSGELEDILGVPTSQRTAAEAKEAGITLTSLDEHPELDLSVDGADQINGELDAIKGGGGALLREKVVASASETYIIIVDERKLTSRLGEEFPLPIEILPFSLGAVKRKLESMRVRASLRTTKGTTGPFVTDNGNYILDADFGYIAEPRVLDGQLKEMPGVLETGLFIDYANVAYVGTPKGVRAMRRPGDKSRQLENAMPKRNR